jgi:hypothetical protein
VFGGLWNSHQLDYFISRNLLSLSWKEHYSWWFSWFFAGKRTYVCTYIIGKLQTAFGYWILCTVWRFRRFEQSRTKSIPTKSDKVEQGRTGSNKVEQSRTGSNKSTSPALISFCMERKKFPPIHFTFLRCHCLLKRRFFVKMSFPTDAGERERE